MKKSICSILFIAFFFSMVHSQDTTAIEKDLLKSYAHAHHWEETSNLPHGEIN